MKVHPVGDLFPLLEGDAFDELVEDIREQGLLEKIWVTPEHKILDGRNRYRACKKAGVEPKTRVCRRTDYVEFVVSLNLKRRHLNESQRAMVAARIAKLQRGRPNNGPIDCS